MASWPRILTADGEELKEMPQSSTPVGVFGIYETRRPSQDREEDSTSMRSAAVVNWPPNSRSTRCRFFDYVVVLDCDGGLRRI